MVANSVAVRDGFKSINENGGWRVQFRDDSPYGNDKAKVIEPYAGYLETMGEVDRPIIAYAGDGVGDISAAGHTDLLFAKQGEGTYFKHYHDR